MRVFFYIILYHIILKFYYKNIKNIVDIFLLILYCFFQRKTKEFTLNYFSFLSDYIVKVGRTGCRRPKSFDSFYDAMHYYAFMHSSAYNNSSEFYVEIWDSGKIKGYLNFDYIHSLSDVPVLYKFFDFRSRCRHYSDLLVESEREFFRIFKHRLEGETLKESYDESL